MICCDICEIDITGIANAMVFKPAAAEYDSKHFKKDYYRSYVLCSECYLELFGDVKEKIQKAQNKIRNEKGNLRRIHDAEYNQIIKQREGDKK